MSKTLLCFGDSNTYGTPAGGNGESRLPLDQRWPGVLRELLGSGYHVVEEGLRGRTTDVDYPDRVGRNGRTYLMPCLESHNPIDVVVVMLGTNDLKTQFGRSAAEIAEALGGYIDDIERLAFGSDTATPRTLLVSPILVDPSQSRFPEFGLAKYGHQAAGKSAELASHIAAVAERRGVGFLDAAKVARAGGDGIHLSFESHEPLAHAVVGVVQALE